MNVEVCTTPGVFDDLYDEWCSLLHRSDQFFLNPGWQKAWWAHFPSGELAVTVVRDEEGNIKGIAPWFVDDGVVRFVGCVDIVDYLDILYEPSSAEDVIGALLDFLTSEQSFTWEKLDLCNIPAASPTRNLLVRLGQERGLQAEADVQEVCPVIKLPDAYDTYLDSLDKKQRHELRRKRRRTGGYDVHWYLVGPEHDLEEEIEHFLGLMANSSPEKAAFLEQPGHREFFIHAARVSQTQGHLDLIFLTIDGNRVASMLQFGYGDRMLLYNSGLNAGRYGALSPGIVLLTYSVENAIERGFKHYDFLRGDEEYKFRMGAEANEIYQVIIERT